MRTQLSRINLLFYYFSTSFSKNLRDQQNKGMSPLQSNPKSNLDNLRYVHYNNISNNNFGTIVNYNLNPNDVHHNNVKRESDSTKDASPVPGDLNNMKFGIFSSIYGNPHPVMFNPSESPNLYINNPGISVYQHAESRIQNRNMINFNRPLDQVVKVENDAYEEATGTERPHSINNNNYLYSNNYNHILYKQNNLNLQNLSEKKLEGHQNISSLISMINKHKETNKKSKSLHEENMDVNKFDTPFNYTEQKKISLSKAHSQKINSSFQKCSANKPIADDIT